MRHDILKRLTLAHLSVGAPPTDTLEAAAAAGFGAVGLRICARRPGDVFAHPVLGVPGAAQVLRRRAQALGVRLSNLSAYQFYPEVDITTMLPVIEVAHEMGAPILVVNGFDPDRQRFLDRFARYCEHAAQAGLRIALEFLPYSAVRNQAEALDVVVRSGADNAGLLHDALHLQRSGGSAADLASVPAARTVFAQLCDAPAEPPSRRDEDLMEEARHARLPPGQGGLALYAFLDALPAGCEIEYEVARADMRERSAVDKARAAADDAVRFLSAYAAARAGTERAGR